MPIPRSLGRTCSCAIGATLALLGASPAAGAAGAPTAAAEASPSRWDVQQQRQVVAAGLMQNSGGSFAGASQLTAAQANADIGALAARLAASGVTGTEPPRPRHGSITMTTLDAMVVEALGLGAVAAHVQATAAGVGLRPPSYFGTEVVARFLGLRYEHPTAYERLDLFPYDPTTRAEAAWSLAAALALGQWGVDYAREALGGFTLPSMSADQLEALRIAVSRIGYPYIWGGTTDDTSDGLPHGGFDCSGFVWRVFKVSGLPWGTQIQGRTAAEQAGEIPRSRRLRVNRLEPGDLLFFGTAHFNGRATESSIVHEGIYLGDNWVIHSSAQGVYVLPLLGSWLGGSFAWGRRIID